MKNIFIITTPFQFLGALEAIFKFGLKDNILLILDNKLENNAKQLTLLIEEHKSLFNTIIRFGFESKSKFFKNVKLLKQLKKDIFNNLFIGDLGSIQKIYLSNLSARNIYLLDDGGKTILIYNDFIKGKEFFKNGFRQIRFKLFGLKTSFKKKIKFFTFFNLSDNSEIDVIQHNFDYFKELYRLKEKEIQKKIFILGQPLVENNRVSSDSYERYLNTIITNYPDCEVYYLMHRREVKTQLESYSLKKSLNIIESLIPGEIFFSKMDFKPKAIVGINTTLLFSLKKIFDDLDILSFSFKDEEILKSKNWFEDSIMYFRQNNIQIIK